MFEYATFFNMLVDQHVGGSASSCGIVGPDCALNAADHALGSSGLLSVQPAEHATAVV
jgi:hypothetical protein